MKNTKTLETRTTMTFSDGDNIDQRSYDGLVNLTNGIVIDVENQITESIRPGKYVVQSSDCELKFSIYPHPDQLHLSYGLYRSKDQRASKWGQ